MLFSSCGINETSSATSSVDNAMPHHPDWHTPHRPQHARRHCTVSFFYFLTQANNAPYHPSISASRPKRISAWCGLSHSSSPCSTSSAATRQIGRNISVPRHNFSVHPQLKTFHTGGKMVPRCGNLVQSSAKMVSTKLKLMTAQYQAVHLHIRIDDQWTVEACTCH